MGSHPPLDYSIEARYNIGMDMALGVSGLTLEEE
jgi:hypothetical protein